MPQTHWLCGRISICFATLAQFQVGFWLYSFQMKTCYTYICATWWNMNLQLHVYFRSTRWLQTAHNCCSRHKGKCKESLGKSNCALWNILITFSYMTVTYALFLTPQRVIYLLHNWGHMLVSCLDSSACICYILCYNSLCASLTWIQIEDSRLNGCSNLGWDVGHSPLAFKMFLILTMWILHLATGIVV